MSEAVKVMVRVRPMNQKQKDKGCVSIVEVDGKNNQININKLNVKEPPKSFSYDFVFGIDSLQSSIYEQSAFSLVDNVLDGYNGTIFAYGQTGCGKTFTMMGTSTQQGKGVIPRTFNQIMTITMNQSNKTYLIKCSFLQIYNEQIHDLLSKDIKARMDLKESPSNGVFVKDLTQFKVDSIGGMQKYMELGFSNRAVRATNMNTQSSRSHSIFTIVIQSQQTDQMGNQKFKASKLNLVDLAGSERIAQTGTTGDGMNQATKINLSLSALGNVISALVDGKIQHVPYRDSKLTRLLQDSLGGNTKTVMIAVISPANTYYDESLSTLRYASRAKFIKNKPIINEDPKDAQLREMSEQIKRLKAMLDGREPVEAGKYFKQTNGQKLVHRIVEEKEKEKEKEKQNGDLWEEQLRSKDEQLKMEQQQKRKMQQKLQNLEKMFEKKDNAGQQNKQELQKIKKLKQKLKVQKKKQQEYKQQKIRKEQQKLNIEKSYLNLHEEMEDLRLKFTQLRVKYISSESELKDIQKEHQAQKEQLLDTIRTQEKQIKKFKAILNILMNADQLDSIVNNSDWSEEKMEWTIPNFVYRQRMVSFPKLQPKNTEEKERKEVIFRNYSRTTQQQQDEPPPLKLNSVVRRARQNSNQAQSPYEIPNKTNGSIRVQLQPIKSDSFQRIKLPCNDSINERFKKVDRLDPIQSTDSQKRM